MGVNYWGVVHGTKAFLPHLRAAGEGHIVNMSSVFGLVSVPTQSAYNSAKFAVRGFSDALRMELEIEGAPVSVTTVHPGGVKTNIAAAARSYVGGTAMSGGATEPKTFERMAITTPERAARRILAAVERNRRRVLVGPDAAVIDAVSRLPGGLYQRALIRGRGDGVADFSWATGGGRWSARPGRAQSHRLWLRPRPPSGRAGGPTVDPAPPESGPHRSSSRR